LSLPSKAVVESGEQSRLSLAEYYDTQNGNLRAEGSRRLRSF
jgi:hypothetical protein